jgi:transposase
MLSEDLKWRIIYCYEEGYKSKEIAKRLYVSKTTVTNICKIFDKWGCVNDPFTGKSGKRKIFTSEDMQVNQLLLTNTNTVLRIKNFNLKLFYRYCKILFRKKLIII